MSYLVAMYAVNYGTAGCPVTVCCWELEAQAAVASLALAILALIQVFLCEDSTIAIAGKLTV